MERGFQDLAALGGQRVCFGEGVPLRAGRHREASRVKPEGAELDPTSREASSGRKGVGGLGVGGEQGAIG